MAAQRLVTVSGVAFVPHDLRRTAASHMTSLGIPRFVVAQILNHVESGVTKVYDRHSYDAEKRQALEACPTPATLAPSSWHIRDPPPSAPCLAHAGCCPPAGCGPRSPVHNACPSRCPVISVDQTPPLGPCHGGGIQSPQYHRCSSRLSGYRPGAAPVDRWADRRHRCPHQSPNCPAVVGSDRFLGCHYR